MRWLLFIPLLCCFPLRAQMEEVYLERYKTFLSENSIDATPMDSFARFHVLWDSYMAQRGWIAFSWKRDSGYHIFLRPDVIEDTLLCRIIVFHELSHVMGLDNKIDGVDGHICQLCNRIMRREMTPSFLEYTETHWEKLLDKLAKRLKRL